jgi:hypothetical protein
VMLLRQTEKEMADELEVIYSDFMTAMAARDAAIEAIDEAYRALKIANSQYDKALVTLAEYVGQSDSSQGKDMGDIFGGSGFGLSAFDHPRNIKDIFGDLF